MPFIPGLVPSGLWASSLSIEMLHINPLCYSILQSLSIQMKHTHPTISQRWYLLGLIGTCLLLVWISSQVFLVKSVLFVLGDDTHMTSMKIFKIPTPLSSYVQNSSTALTLDVQFQTNCSPQPLRFPLQTNQWKGNNPRMTIICYQVFPSGRLSFSVSTH